MNPADHIGLVHFVVHKMRLDQLEYDDAIGIGMVALCEAAPRYDRSKGGGANYIIMRVRYAIMEQQRRLRGSRRQHPPPRVVSIDADPARVMVLEDGSVDWREWGDRLDAARELRRVWPLLTERERRFVTMRAQGAMNAQIAVAEGVSERRIGQLLGRMRRRVAA